MWSLRALWRFVELRSIIAGSEWVSRKAQLELCATVAYFSSAVLVVLAVLSLTWLSFTIFILMCFFPVFVRMSSGRTCSCFASRWKGGCHAERRKWCVCCSIHVRPCRERAWSFTPRCRCVGLRHELQHFWLSGVLHCDVTIGPHHWDF